MPRSAHRRRRIIVSAALGVVVVVLALAVAIAAMTLLHVRSSVSAARALFAQVVAAEPTLSTQAGRAAAIEKLDQAQGDLNGAGSQIQSSIPLDLARFVPGLATQRNGLAGLVSDASRAATLGRGLIDTVGQVGGPTQPGQVPLDRLASLQAQASSTSVGLGALVRSPSGLWSSLGGARQSFNAEVGSVSHRLSGASQALGAASLFLGANGPRTYLVAGENNSEMRDQGMVLSYAVLHLDRGAVSVGPPGHISDLTLAKPVPAVVPAGTQAIFGGLEPTQLWQSVNASADFAWSGRTMAAMYKQATGKSIDGVIGIDVPALADLLSVTGPVSVAGVPEPVTAANAGDLLLHVLYEQEPTGDQVARHEEIGAVAAAAAKRIESGTLDTLALARSVGQAAGGRHLQLWSTDPKVEASIDSAGVSGDPAASQADRTFTMAVENATATKLDYYVRSSDVIDVTIDARGDAVVDSRVTVHNTAPAGQPPSYQLGPDHINSFSPGNYVARIYWWGPAGATQAASVAESGLRLNQGPLAVAAGQQGFVDFQTIVPDAIRHGALHLRLVPQPGLHPTDLVVHLHAPGWSVSGPVDLAMPWATTLQLHWGIRR